MEKLKEKNKFFTKTKICALMLLVAIITNMFSPYSVLLQESQAATPAAGEPYYELSIRPIDDVNTVDEDNWTDETYYYYYDYYQGTVDTTDNYSGTRVVFIDLKVKGSSTVNGADINLKYDNSKLIPAQESYTGSGKNKKYFIQNATGFTNSNSKSNQDFATIGWGTQAINELYTDESRIRTGGAVAPGQQYISDGEVVGTFMFKLADGMTLEDLDTSTFSLVPATGLSEGLQVVYWPDGVQKSVVGSDYLKFAGFATSAKKTLTNIAIKTQPTKTEYYNTEKLDLTNGVLTATYSDNTTEDINMKDALTSGDLTLGATTANANKKTTLNYQGKTVDFSYYLLDSINVNKQLTKMNYEHGDTIDYTGGELNAVYKNASGVSKTKVLKIKDSIASKELTTSATKANVDKPTITYTYHYKTATMNLSITDPVTSISITKQPTTLTYNDGDTINLTGGQITPRTKSGKSLTAVDMTNNKVTVNKKVASINDVPAASRWTIAGGDGLQAGNQTITVTYEGKAANFDIVVNDTISSVSVTTQPTASNKYGTPANQLKFDGVVATVSTTGGGKFTVGANSLKIDTSKYNPNTLTEQQFSVSYGTETATNKIKLTLKNYATGVTVKFPTTQFNYNTTLDEVIEDATYVENYADGTKSIDKPIAKSMVSGYVQRPEASLFDTKHQYDENLTITTGEFTNNQIVTIKDILNNISIGTKPNKITFGYGETFTSNGGVINGNYASGAIAKISIGNSNVTLTEADGSPINMSPAASEFTNGKATKAIKVTYTENGKQYTTTYNIKIEDEISKIEMVTNPKREYKYKEPLSTANGTIKVTYKSTLTDTIKLEDATVTETSGKAFDNTILGTRNLTVTYGGKTTSYEVNVKDYVTGISIAPNAITGKYNSELQDLINNNNIMYTITYAKAGAKTPVALAESMVSGYNKTKVTDQALTITYQDEDPISATNGQKFIANLKVSLDNPTQSIAIKTQPTKTEYGYGDTIDLSNGKITITKANGDTEEKALTDSSVKVTETDGSTVDLTKVTFGKDNTATKTIKVTYDGKDTTYQIKVTNKITGIKMHTTPKAQYNVNDALDLTTDGSNPGEILVTRQTGTPSVVSIKDSQVTVTGFDSSKENTKLPLTVSYTENGETKTTTYNVSVKDTVTSIKMKATPKTEYKYNEQLDLANGTISITKGSGTKDIAITSDMVSGYDPTKLGKQTITVTYGGKTTTYEVNVKDYVTGISVTPNAITGKYNSELQDLINNNNIMYTITYAKAGAKTPVALTESMVSGYNKTSVTDQTLTVSYTDADTQSGTQGQTFKANLKVSLSNPTQSIAIKTQPTKTQYGYGDTIDLSNGKITITKANGDTEEKALTDSSVKVTETDGSTVDLTKVTFGKDNTATKTIKVTYDGKDTTYQIKVTNKITGIKMHTTPKAQYNVNDALDLTTDGSNPGEILVTRQTGTPSVVSIKDSQVTVTGFDSSKENTKLPLTVSYTENGETKTTTYNVSVKDTVTSIKMKATPKTEYKYNEQLDLANGTISITKGSGTKDIAITSDMVSGYDPTKLGKQTITVTYGGKTTTYEVNVKDYVTGISITPNAITGTYNDELEALINENDIIYTVTYAKAGATSPRTLTESMVAGYNKTSLTAQNLTVTYADKDANSYTNGKTFTTTLGIKLENNVAKVTITPPTKAEYNHGDKIDLTGGKITVTYTDGTTKEEPITSAVITEKDGGALNMNPTISEYGKDNKLSKTLTLKYTAKNGVTGTTSYPITIANTIQSVTIDTLPTKVKYNIKDTLDTTGGKLKITRATGKAETIDITKDMVSGFDSSKENTKLPLTISYTENGITKTTTYTVSVEDPITSMTLKTTPKTEYKYGEPLDISKGVITIVRPSGPEDKQITKEMVTGYDPTKLGQQELTIKYGGQELKYKVNVKDYVKGIVLTPPAKTKYEYGESLDLTGGNIQKIMASGTATTPIALTDSQVKLSTFNPNKEGAQTINVAYEGFTEKFGVIVEDNLQSIKIKTEPTKTKYKYGEALDITGGQISAIKSSGKAENIDITTSMVSGYNPNKLGKQTITITYKGKKAQYNVEVEDYIKDIKLTNPNKLIYKVNEKMDLTGGKVTPVMASGIASPAIPMTNADVTITGFYTTTVGAKIVKVSYKGISKTFGITVEDGYSEMKIKTLPTKTEYKYGESLDLTGGTIEITKDSGTKETINITKDMISGYNSKKLGAQILTVTYQGLTQQFVVKVEDYIASLKIQKPTKVEYEYGEDIELTGGKVSIIMASGAISESTAMTGAMITGYNPKAEGTQTIKVEYKGLQGNFQVKIEDKIKGISVNTEPNKTEYKYGENLDITGATIDVVKSSGITTIPVTPNMVSGFSATTPGTQIITITYGGFTTKFVVKVSEKQEEPKQDDNKTEDNKDNGTKEDNTTNKNEEITKDNNSTKKNYVEIERNDVTENQEQSEEQQPEEEVKKPTITKENPTKVPETKPTETLGVKDEKTENNETKDNSRKQKASIICLIAAILLLILLSSRRNVKIYVEEKGEFVLGGLDKISKNNKYIDVDKYLDGDTYEKQVKIVLSDSISEKLDKDKIEIKHRGNKKNYKIKYEGKEIEIILK